ncbi:hypothetical protein BT63DRAFT_426919 [Microthyrium microscopicum]|uniref:Tubby C-terminal-like domain-containing protein n=1 Tax=Microthyrium microscopicum TaxID=703497 RepID=A0A6A6U7Z5_9PEZI|nr:hypothetical protein BT63DRAFT_426919 [Microthyrium microscopicum]
MAIAALAPLAAPIAVNTDFIANKTETIILSTEPLSRDWRVSLHDGTPLLTIIGESMSASHRKTVSTPDGQTLYQIRRQLWSMGNTYYAERTEDGPKLWELESHSGFTGQKHKLMFNNVAAGGQPAMLDFKNRKMGGISGEVKLIDQSVANIELKRGLLKKDYYVTVAQGVDMSLLVGMVVAIEDRMKTRRAGAAGA